MVGLTRRQKQLLVYVHECIKGQGYPPTLREIGTHMSIKSTNGVHCHLVYLLNKGYLEKDVMKSRALRITQKGYDELGVECNNG